jgi:N-acyl-D-amino-acid deacylase
VVLPVEKKAVDLTLLFQSFLDQAVGRPGRIAIGAMGLLLCGAMATVSAQPDPHREDPQAISHAIERGMAVLQKGIRSYPNHRQCFSCHHQALPLLSLLMNQPQGTRSDVFSGTANSIVQFTRAAYIDSVDRIGEGNGLGGRSLTAGYALWTFDMAGHPSDEVTESMVRYLLHHQQPDGSWEFHSFRPPAASSKAMTAALAIYGLRAYAGRDRSGSMPEVYQRCISWFMKSPPADSHEDLIGKLWGMKLLQGQDAARAAHLADKAQGLLEQLKYAQHGDGGWSQVEGMNSDAYATGQAMMMLLEWEGEAVVATPLFRAAIGYLLREQLPDGSWRVETRAKPVQVFFDNGDPHGTHQFISMMATAWSTAALSATHHRVASPLSFLLGHRSY